MLGRVWNAIRNAVDGLKTLCVVAMFVGLGLADYFDVVNVKPALDLLLGEDKAAKVMVLMPLVFGTLRFISSGPVRWTKLWNQAKEAGDGPDDFSKGAQ